MGNLVPSSRWDDVPYFEANAVLTGGPDCPDNLPIQALLNRTEHLKGMVENMSSGFDAVPATNKGLFIVVKQPHMRMMMWNGSQYIRAPWHQPCQLFFSYDNPSSIPGALPVRADVSYQQSNYPDVVARLGLSGSGTFSLVESRGEFLRVLDNGRGVDAGRVNRAAQGGSKISAFIYGGSSAGNSGRVNSWWADQIHDSTSGLEEEIEQQCDPQRSGALIRKADNPTLNATPGTPSLRMGTLRPRNVAFPLWMTI